jgi:outer membrane receptor for ferric coprogen and ferric-rhodotorulic acid
MPDRAITITMNHRTLPTACALAIAALSAPSGAQTDSAASAITVTGKRAHRISTGATGLALDLKETPQSISILDKQDLADYGLSGSNEALRLATGLDVERYETNRSVYNARGFEVQSTQIDGLGMSNSWGTVVGDLDTYLFERIELVRGANGLLTGVGNASGTINYVRKRPLNQAAAEGQVAAGSWGLGRVAVDMNQVFGREAAWAGRVVAALEDKDSHLRDLHDRRATVYGVVDGQIGRQGVLTLGFTHRDNQQRSPMWGSLTLNYADGSPAQFDRSSSTSQRWTYWNTRNTSAFVEYSQGLGTHWEAKFTLDHGRTSEATKLLYAYTYSGGLNADNTGLQGWPYRSHTDTDRTVLDAQLTGRFQAWGRQHALIVGLTRSHEAYQRDTWATTDFAALPAFPYSGDAYPEPTWAARAPNAEGEQTLTRLYAASHWSLAPGLKGIAGVNAIRLERSGNSVYGSVTTPQAYPDTREVSPYLGLTYEITRQVNAYLSYSDIFQNQDQYSIQRVYLDPMQGVNTEAGVKADWLGGRLLTTAAVFSAEQRGLAVFAGIDSGGQYYYEGRDVKSRGLELEATGKLGADTQVALGLTHIRLTGADGQDTFEWVPRSLARLRFDTRLSALPSVRWGAGLQWQSEVSKNGGARQAAYAVANAFAAWSPTPKGTLRLTVNNLFDKTYIDGLTYGAIYGAPRNTTLSYTHAL